MDLLYSIFFGACVSGLAYSTLARRVGYGNNKNVVSLIGVIFVIATIVAYTVAKFH
jgi:hypothetical protein